MIQVNRTMLLVELSTPEEHRHDLCLDRRLQKGMLKVRISCSGVACHSGYPKLGYSAIDPVVKVLHALKKRAWPASEELGETTMNIGMVNGGQAANALAEHCEAVLMFRLIQPPETVLDVVRGIAEEHGCSVEVRGVSGPGARTDEVTFVDRVRAPEAWCVTRSSVPAVVAAVVMLGCLRASTMPDPTQRYHS